MRPAPAVAATAAPLVAAATALGTAETVPVGTIDSSAIDSSEVLAASDLVEVNDLAPSTTKDPFAATVEDLPAAPPPASLAPVAFTPPREPFASAPSTQDLLQRAAQLGPARMTWESIVLPADPILDQKATAHVSERRARFTRMVKGTLGACVGVCLLAIVVSALSGGPEGTAAAATPGAKTVPARVEVSVEALAGAPRAKATAQAVPQRRLAPVAAAAPRAKRR